MKLALQEMKMDFSNQKASPRNMKAREGKISLVKANTLQRWQANH